MGDLQAVGHDPARAVRPQCLPLPDTRWTVLLCHTLLHHMHGLAANLYKKRANQ